MHRLSEYSAIMPLPK